MKIAVLFDGAGLARLGLERAGHDCTGFELDPLKHGLSRMVGSGRTVLADVRDVDLSTFDAVWASPPCQLRSSARTQGAPVSPYAVDLLDWALALPHSVLWVENIMSQRTADNGWGRAFNAAQFGPVPIQNRNRIIGGRYPEPTVDRPYRKAFPGVCPCITATEYKGCASDTRRASRFYGRRLDLFECAYHQGLDAATVRGWIEARSALAPNLTPGEWRRNLYEAIGNGVPVFMAQAFGCAVAQAGLTAA